VKRRISLLHNFGPLMLGLSKTHPQVLFDQALTPAQPPEGSAKPNQ
jgi:hypothetical protein